MARLVRFFIFFLAVQCKALQALQPDRSGAAKFATAGSGLPQKSLARPLSPAGSKVFVVSPHAVVEGKASALDRRTRDEADGGDSYLIWRRRRTTTTRTTTPAPINCEWNVWDPWGACSQTCGGGIHKRHRSINQNPRHGGAQCEGGSKMSQPCNKEACPVAPVAAAATMAPLATTKEPTEEKVEQTIKQNKKLDALVIFVAVLLVVLTFAGGYVVLTRAKRPQRGPREGGAALDGNNPFGTLEQDGGEDDDF